MSPCSRCQTAIEEGDLRCAICALPLVELLPAGAGPARAQILRCTDCNAAIAFSAEAQAPRCGFCGATMTVEQPSDPIEVAQVRVPFTVDRDAAEASLRGWLGKRGYFAPKTLREEAILESLTPLCWAGWLVHAQASVVWTADSDEGSRRSAWAPHAGEVPMQFEAIVVPASRGLDHEECRLLVPYYDLSRAVAVEANVSGEVPAMVESFDAQRSAARHIVQRAIEATAKTRVGEHVPGRRSRNVHVSCLLEGQTTDRVALPAWVLAYRYRGTPFRAIVHGQRPEVVFGSAPTDWAKVARLAISVVGAVLAIVAVIALLSGCSGTPAPLDAPVFVERCIPSEPFAPLTGRVAIQGTLNVHVDAGGLIEVDTTSILLLAMDLIQTGTSVAVTAEVCKIEVPDVPLAGQDMPIHFVIPDAAIASVGTADGTATLSSPDQACADFTSAPITLVLGARLDPTMIETAPLPVADNDGVFPTCPPSADTSCRLALGTGCACDQESDTFPGATLIARNVPAIDLDRVYATLRTAFSLRGQVFSTDAIRGEIDASLETGVLACRLGDGLPCSTQNIRTLRALNPVITQQAGNPSTFRATRIAAGTPCAEIIEEAAILFPR